MTRGPRLLLLALAWVVTISPSFATVVAPVDLRELVLSATCIVYGRVVDLRVVEADQRVTTVVTLGMTAFIKGDGGRTVEFQVPGGQIGRYRTVVVGAPAVAVGDEIVVFLTEHVAGPPVVVGFSQGLLRVVRAPVDGAPTVLAPPFSRDGSGGRVVRGASVPRVIALSAFVDDVRTLVTQTADAARVGAGVRAGGGAR